MSSDELDLRAWLATPEGPPERVWRAALRLIAEEEAHVEDPVDEIAQDEDQDQDEDQGQNQDLAEIEDGSVGEGSVEEGGLGLGDAEPLAADEGTQASFPEEDSSGDPFA